MPDILFNYIHRRRSSPPQKNGKKQLSPVVMSYVVILEYMFLSSSKLVTSLSYNERFLENDNTMTFNTRRFLIDDNSYCKLRYYEDQCGKCYPHGDSNKEKKFQCVRKSIRLVH